VRRRWRFAGSMVSGSRKYTVFAGVCLLRFWAVRCWNLSPWRDNEMTFHRFALCACFTLIAIAAGMAAAKEPSRWGFSDRVERHMLPAVTTGPFDPAWSGDGRIAFSARGDIWVIGAKGGEAVAVTQGPNYYFEPAWSPDNKKIACATIDPAGKLGIATIALEGDKAEAIDTGPGVAVEPAWSQDGRSLYYVNMVSGGGRGTGGANIYRHDFASSSNALVTSGFQPAVSPDGKELAYVAPVQGQIGTGGLWVRPIAGGAARLVRYEQSEYRMKPAWTRDGKSLLYVSDEEGPNAVRIVSTEGGEPVRLTIDARDAYSPTPSPDGGHFVFVSNRSGPTVLYTVDMGVARSPPGRQCRSCRGGQRHPPDTCGCGCAMRKGGVPRRTSASSHRMAVFTHPTAALRARSRWTRRTISKPRANPRLKFRLARSRSRRGRGLSTSRWQ
jgi:tricorn protease-like protein